MSYKNKRNINNFIKILNIKKRNINIFIKILNRNIKENLYAYKILYIKINYMLMIILIYFI